MKNIKLYANAKINLHLDVVSKEEGGYHRVNTVMQTLSLCDDVEVALNVEGINSISCDSPAVPLNEKNLAWRAADLFFERTGLSFGADIKITKRIPVAAGLAGGSTDAAAVFLGLNILCGEPLSEGELLELSSRLGADVPFCIAGGTKFADRFGDVLHPFVEMPDCYIVVACGKEGVSTPWAYATLDAKYNNFESDSYTPRDISKLEAAVCSGDISAVCQNLYNIFEDAIEPERPEVTKIKSELLKMGALGVMMSGSGPSVFGVFADEKSANNATEHLISLGIDAFLTKPISK